MNRDVETLKDILDALDTVEDLMNNLDNQTFEMKSFLGYLMLEVEDVLEEEESVVMD